MTAIDGIDPVVRARRNSGPDQQERWKNSQ
jgi:hypothetical protein